MNDREKTNHFSLRRIIALIGILCGAAGSMGFMLYAGRNNKSVLLILLFVAWVLFPFVVLLGAELISKSWSNLARLTLDILTIVLSIGSLVSYSGVLLPSGTKTAFIFLVFPLFSLLLIAIVILIIWLRSRKSDS